MRHAITLRESNGRILGKLDDYFFDNDDEFWEDQKEYNVVYPNHQHKLASPVVSYHISQLKDN